MSTVDKDKLIEEYYQNKNYNTSPKERKNYALKEKTINIISKIVWAILITLYTIWGATTIAIINGMMTIREMLTAIGYQDRNNPGEILTLSNQAGGTFLDQLPIVYANKEEYIIFYIITPLITLIIITIIFIITKYFTEKKILSE